MHPLEGWKFSALPPGDRPRLEPLPPALAVLAGVCATVGVLTSLLVAGPAVYVAFAAIETLMRLVPGAGAVVHSGLGGVIVPILAVLAALVLPVLQGWGAVHLFTRRGRTLLLYGCLPVTVLVALGATSALLSGHPGDAVVFLALLGPAAAPLFALAPSVRRWLEDGTEPTSVRAARNRS